MKHATPERRWEAAYTQTLNRLRNESGPGGRNVDLFSAACFLGRFRDFPGWRRGAIEAELVATATALGLPEKEARTTAKRGLQYGAASALAVDDRPADILPPATETWAELCARKGLDPDATAARWGVTPTTRDGLPAVTYPVHSRARIRVLTVPKAVPCWAKTGSFDDLYGATSRTGTPVYLVNGESAVWACDAAGVDAVCTCVGESASGLTEARVAAFVALNRPVRIIADNDKAGRTFALAARDQLRAAGVECTALATGLDKPGADAGDLYMAHGANLLAVLATLPDLDAPAPGPDDALFGDLPERDPDAAPYTADEEGEPIARHLPGLAAPPTMRTPKGYAVAPSGVYRLPASADKEPERISTGPIVVTARMADASTGEEYTELTYKRPSGTTWERMVVRRDEVMIARKVAELTAHGLPITSGTAGSFCAYAAACEESLSRTGDSVRPTTAVMGWHGPAFLRGEHAHVPDDADCPDYRGAHEIGPIVRSIHDAGSLATWTEHVWPWLHTYPVMRAAVATACVGPLLAILRCESFALDICGETSLGKTTTLRLAASVWGSPEYMRSWAATRTGIERVAIALTDHPLLLDDTKRSDRPEQCGAIVYDIVAGEGKTRATVAGLQAIQRFRVPVISTGEGPLSATMTDAGGLRARCLTIWGSPLGGASEEAGDTALAIVGLAAEHYGHAGRALADWLIALTPNDRGALRERFLVERRRYTEIASRYPAAVGPRLASHAAAICIAGQCLESALGLPQDLDWFAPELFCAAVMRGASADRAREAMDAMLAWILLQPAAIFRAPNQVLPPRGQWLGAIREGRLYVSIDDADTRLKAYSIGEIRSSWQERGWIETDGKYIGKRVTVGDARVRMYSVTTKALTDCGVDLAVPMHEQIAPKNEPGDVEW